MRPTIGKKIIYGCEARGDAESPYLTRYTLLSTKWLQVCVHIFHRSDGDELHDHPWPFVSLILWRGYTEEIASDFAVSHDSDTNHPGWVAWENRNGMSIRRRARPGMILFRRADHAHRVELIDGKPAISLVFMGPKRRTWGFFTRQGWQRWTEYFKERGC